MFTTKKWRKTKKNQLFWEFKVCYFSDRPSNVANCDQIIAYKLKMASFSPQTESGYLLQNTFSQINGKKLNISNNPKVDAIPLSKRRPYVQKLLCERLKNNFYEEKTFPNLLKKFWTLRSSLHQTSRRDIFSKIHLPKNKKLFILTRALVAIIVS